MRASLPWLLLGALGLACSPSVPGRDAGPGGGGDAGAPATAEIHRAKIIVVGNGVTDLDERNVWIIVPPADGEIVII